jgi:hypothetical protein
MATAAIAKNTKESIFEWEGKDKNGKLVRGEIRAGGEAVVSASLRRQGILITKVKKRRTSGGRSIKQKGHRDLHAPVGDDDESRRATVAILRHRCARQHEPAHDQAAERHPQRTSRPVPALSSAFRKHPAALRFPVLQPRRGRRNCCSTSGSAADANGDDRCDSDPDVWSEDTWSALNFQINDEHYFVYSFDASGTLSAAVFTATANGDLDCDGTFSTFQRSAFGDPQATKAECSLRGSAAFYVEKETE